MQVLNEQYWLLIQTIYSHDAFEFNSVFPSQILVILMNEIGLEYTRESGSIFSCCDYHKKSSKLLTHNVALQENEEEDFQFIEVPYDQQENSESRQAFKKMVINVDYEAVDGGDQKAFNFQS